VSGAWAFRSLETARLRLRAFAEPDLDDIERIFSDHETLRYWSGKPVQNRAQAEALLQRELDLAARDDVLTWGLALRTSDRLIGKFTLFNYSAQNRRAEVGYILDREHWGEGYMSEVMERIIAHAFNELGLHRLEADTDPDNRPSLALLEKFGFQREGLFRDRWLLGESWADSVMLGLINSRH
jgi:RimJ/RimL family protein N-acetyltransferase